MSSRTLPQPRRRPKQPKTASLGSSDLASTKPYSHYFLYYGHWSASDQLRAFARDCPDALIPWSLNSRRDTEEEVLVCNLVQGERKEKEKLRRRLWPGKWQGGVRVATFPTRVRHSNPPLDPSKLTTRSSHDLTGSPELQLGADIYCCFVYYRSAGPV
jgi:hypothetical protein